MTEQRLNELLADWFTAADLEALCTALSLDWDAINVGTRQQVVDNLMTAASAAGQLFDLYDEMQKLRPEYVSNDDEDSGKKASPANPGVLSADGPPERVVNTGFTDDENPEKPADRRTPLKSDSIYYFWLEVGAPVEGSIEKERVELNIDEIPPEAKLQVVLFHFEGELGITKEMDVGELIIQSDGKVRVATAVVKPSKASKDLLERRLFFPVTTPKEEGAYRLRCNIYYEQILLQSRLVTAEVAAQPEKSIADVALAAEADYIISKSLDSSQMAKMPKHTLSLMLNDNGGGSHGFRFFGGSDFKNDATFTEGELEDLLRQARGALRKAAWGDEDTYKDQAYRYTSKDLGRLRTDLFRCAIRGYRFYDAIINRVAGDADKAWDLADLMVKPGQIQIASKQSARLVIPAALIYDYPLDTGLKASQFKLCPEFEKNLRAKAKLEDTACFKGDCPSYGDDDTVCPSGFWGYRHAIGMPVTVPNAPDAPVEIKLDGAPEITMAVSTDPAFRGREEHEARIKSLMPDLQFHYADERPETIDFMKKTDPHVLYFFCHGRLANNVPSIEVGPPKTRGITRDNLRNSRIRWRKTRPLVFINGCHTTALDPERAIDLVGGFIDTSHAAGVIGTEITNFVPVARIFAEECLKRFFVDKQPIGEAIRGARLAVLEEANPLGLMYVPYVMTGLRLVN